MGAAVATNGSPDPARIRRHAGRQLFALRCTVIQTRSARQRSHTIFRLPSTAPRLGRLERIVSCSRSSRATQFQTGLRLACLSQCDASKSARARCSLRAYVARVPRDSAGAEELSDAHSIHSPGARADPSGTNKPLPATGKRAAVRRGRQGSQRRKSADVQGDGLSDGERRAARTCRQSQWTAAGCHRGDADEGDELPPRGATTKDFVTALVKARHAAAETSGMLLLVAIVLGSTAVATGVAYMVLNALFDRLLR